MRPLRAIAAGPVAVFLAALALGCSEPRQWAHDDRGTLAWREDIQPLFAARCASCHSGATPAGSYDVSKYTAALGDRAAPVAVAGEAGSKLLQVLDPSKADATHQPVSDVFARVQKWVVEDRLAYLKSAVHTGGLLLPGEPDFHGAILQGKDWNFGACQKCHGEDFKGGSAQRSCFACHEKGPTDCQTCHGPTGLHGKSGAHAKHLQGGDLQKQLDCSECHTKPNAWNDVGHILDASGRAITTTAHAPVTFGAFAATSTKDRTAAPSYDTASAGCASVYCHGGAFNDTAATNPKPHWTPVGADQAKCGTCHGLPPSNHKMGDLACSTCHGLVVDADKKIINAALHMDGKIELGNGQENCSACHGSAQTPAPPPDLSGSSDPSSVTVGAHLVHLTMPHALRGPLGCNECHADITAVDSPGHIDHPLPATVFPADNYTGIANADGAQPTWDRNSATCSSVYCHGGGTHFASDTATTLFRTPSWIVPDTTAARCGACHGIPPLDGVTGHEPTARLTTCTTCHPSTIDGSGTLLFTDLPDGGSTTTHINGVIDVVQAQ